MSRDPPDFATVYEESVDAPHPILHILVEYGRLYPLPLVVMLAGAILSPLVGLAPPYLLGVAIDSVVEGTQSYSLILVPDSWLPETERAQFLLTFGLLVGAGVASLAIGAVNTLSRGWFEHNVKHEVRTDVYDATQHLGLDFFTSARTGDVMSVLNADVNQLRQLLNHWPLQVLGVALQALGMTAVMLYLHWQLALLTLLVVVPTAVLSLIFSRYVEPEYIDARAERGEINSRVETGISGIETVKSYTNEDYEYDRVAESSWTYRNKTRKIHMIGAVFLPALRLLTEVVPAIVFLVGGWVVLFGPPFGIMEPLRAGTLLTFFLYGRRFAGQMRDVGGIVNTYHSITASAKRIIGLMVYPISVADAPDADPLDDVQGRVEYEDVTFRYPGTEEPALRDVRFEAEPGDFVGVVGPTGAGKTTLLKLLVRFYDPDRGVIRIDGTDIRDVGLDSLREAIGYVSQEPFLFDDTVRENIAYADADAPEAAIIDAAKRANVHEFVTDLPDGYDTAVGERGVKLSGGQRQRIAIARAMLADPPILILDEATSHVDNATEVLIQESLEELTRERTTFAIAHRLSTVRHADEILVLENGEIVERGTHEDLLEIGGLYATLWGVHVGDVEKLPESLDERTA